MSLQTLFQEQAKRLRTISLDKKRYLYDQINWTSKSIGILGQRGLGKTTMMLQYIKENYEGSDKALYISLDNPYFQSVSLYDFAMEFESYGGEILFIDEVHKYDDWSSHVKTIYDASALRVVFSGSSILQINKQKGDLSRRSLIYTLENLSFREYLSLSGAMEYQPISLEDLLENHGAIATNISAQIKPLKYFKEYLECGAYPFVLEDKDNFHQRLVQVINLILETDLPYINRIEMAQIGKLKKLLYLLAINVPFIPNITDLSSATQISRPKVYEYLNHLEQAKIINTLRSKEKGYNVLSKPEKLLMQNTNLSFALSSSVDIGSMREAFFVNQIKNALAAKNRFIDESIYSSKKGDFLVDDKYTFEIGGKNKGFEQIKDISNSYVASDDIEIGYKNKIPLWLFGFLY
ncbi:AAA family ATPase [Sulfuricurvum sp. RIFCSPLOWO2_12_FULL_43_24]|uniref:ATP-binding protein n=1 Tax=Sulfuricurvum sp. RIFCSPLOWO2_12_FULL_43_24 TaxID=1802247 RepID=UPI0008D2E983|nr:AAA family ATPase [Sulfuricurvum sp. RIFCSPLOWO2_12_FULL_43_24]OHD85344.1 MAG: AAA family ATPase [Sulfuricurvum sp. RIFCSPLOWO2_02_FULL_43_45]OHD88672.1 MAG: AAA family ATPase [Sulfuricurvum sp. RIFCSPLOWO2_12_FULL_43_24]